MKTRTAPLWWTLLFLLSLPLLAHGSSSSALRLPPDAPTLTAPANGALDLPPTVTLQWDTVATAVRYHLQVSTMPDLTAPFFTNTDTLTVNEQTIGPLEAGTYYWRVRAFDADSAGAWSSIFNFSVTVSTTLPAPVLVQPADSAADQPSSLILRWNAVAGTQRYQLQLSTVANFNSIVLDIPDITSTQRQIGPLADGTYFWRVRAIGSSGPSPWSEVFSFGVIGLPAPVMLVSPPDGTPDLPELVLLTWSPTMNARRYQLEVTAAANLGTPIIETDTLTGTSVEIGPLATGIYRWRIRGLNNAGSGDWSNMFSFSVLAAPAAPILTSPEDESGNESAVVTLQWNTEPTVTSYHLQVATDTLFTEPVFEDSMLTSVSESIGPLEAGTYYWRVQATNGNGTSPWSATYSFTVVTAPEQSPALLEPVDGAANTNSTLSLRWTAVPKASSYVLVVSQDQDFSTTTLQFLGITVTEQEIGPLDIGTTYYWRVRGRNAAGLSPWSDTFSFSVSLNPTAIERDGDDLPRVFDLAPSYPNPFNPSTTIRFSVPESADVSLTVYDAHGRLIETLVSERLAPGTYHTDWSAGALSSGLYLVRMQSGSFEKTQKLLLLK